MYISHPDKLQKISHHGEFVGGDDKYFFIVTLRADGSFKFGENNKYGYLPSVAIGWSISNDIVAKDSRAPSPAPHQYTPQPDQNQVTAKPPS